MKFFLVFQALFVILVGLSCIGLDVIILRQIVTFTYITFIPGVIILRILNLKNLGLPETVIYSFGLGITFLMLIGLLINTVYPFFGAVKPLSLISLFITLTASITLMAFVNYLRDKKSYNKCSQVYTIKELITDFSTPQLLFLSLLPFMAIIGTYLVNFYQDNGLILLLYIFICLIVVLTIFDKYPKKFYPLIIFVLALSILYGSSLISNNLWGADIHFEYHLASIVQANSIWNPNINIDYNSMLSVTILPPILSTMCNIDLVWVFKIIYPFLFSFIPLGLYILFKSQTNDKIAFLSCFFFISFSVFYTEMLALARQEIGEIFLVLLLLLIITRCGYSKKTLLSLIFGISLVISHYTLTYLYVFLMMIPAYVLLNVTKTHEFQELKRRLTGVNIHSDSSNQNTIIFPQIIVILFIAALLWYGYTSDSYYLKLFFDILNDIVTGFFSSFLNPNYAQGLSLLAHKPISFLHNIDKTFQLTTQFFITVGLLVTILKFEKTNFKREYIALSIFTFVMLLAAIVVPDFALQVNTSRIYHVALILLAPFAIIGGLKIIGFIVKSLNNYRLSSRKELPLQIISVFLIVFFLFETGFVYAVTGDYPTSIALSQNDMNSSDLIKEVSIYNIIDLFDQDIYGVKWFNQHTDVINSTIYVDYLSSHSLIGYGKNLQLYYNSRLTNETTVGKNDFVYLGYPNVVGNIMMMNSTSLNSTFKTSILIPVLNKLNKVYSNGGSEIYTGN